MPGRHGHVQADGTPGHREREGEERAALRLGRRQLRGPARHLRLRTEIQVQPGSRDTLDALHRFTEKPVEGGHPQRLFSHGQRARLRYPGQVSTCFGLLHIPTVNR